VCAGLPPTLSAALTTSSAPPLACASVSSRTSALPLWKREPVADEGGARVRHGAHGAVMRVGCGIVSVGGTASHVEESARHGVWARFNWIRLDD
jgi:hypothetical protein